MKDWRLLISGFLELPIRPPGIFVILIRRLYVVLKTKAVDGKRSSKNGHPIGISIM